MEVSITDIRPSPYQPRAEFDLDWLKKDIEQNGLLEHLKVRKVDGYWELLDGECRWRVLQELAWTEVPITIKQVDDRTARKIVWKTNEARAHYTPKERARYFKRLNESGWFADRIAEELGIVDVRWVQAHLNAFKLPLEMQQHIWDGVKGISISHLMRIDDDFKAGNLGTVIKVLTASIDGELTEAAFRDKVFEGRKKARKEAESRAKDNASKRLKRIADREQKAEKTAVKKKAKDAVFVSISESPGAPDTDKVLTLREMAKQAEAEAKALEEAQKTAEQKQKEEKQRQAAAKASAASAAARAEKKRLKDKERQEKAEERARRKLGKDKEFVAEAFKDLPVETQKDIYYTEEEKATLRGGKRPATAMDPVFAIADLTEKLVIKIESLEVLPPAGRVHIRVALERLEAIVPLAREKFNLEVTNVLEAKFHALPIEGEQKSPRRLDAEELRRVPKG